MRGIDHPTTAIFEDTDRVRYAGHIRGSCCVWLYTAGVKDRVAGFLRTAAPLQQWLDQRVGPDPA